MHAKKYFRNSLQILGHVFILRFAAKRGIMTLRYDCEYRYICKLVKKLRYKKTGPLN
jgi:hypothetical protein